MANKKSKQAKQDLSKLREVSSEAVEAAQAAQAGSEYSWHYGRVTRMGNFELGGGREVVVIWEEGGVTSQQGGISDGEWEIFKLAFLTTGRIAVLSNEPDETWRYDYRFLEAVR